MNWAGRPLHTLDIMLASLRGATTQTGRTVQTVRLTGTYSQGQKVSPAMMKQLTITHDPTCPCWNYRIQPRPLPLDPAQTHPPDQELVA